MSWHNGQIGIPATFIRGGTSKGVFFNLTKLPKLAQKAGKVRDNLLLRVVGSPDPYGKQIDGMGGGTSSTSKVVIISKSTQLDHDIDYLFAQVSIDKAFVDWSGNCGNLTAAVGSFAIMEQLIDPKCIPENGFCTLRVWQVNIQKTIILHVPICNRQVQETGSFALDGVTFPGAEVKVEFVDPVDKGDAMFPTGNVIDKLQVPNVGDFNVTMINAGIPSIFLHAHELGYSGTELQETINNNPSALEKFEFIRAYGAVKMGLIETVEEASVRQHTPKIAFIGQPRTYMTSGNKVVHNTEIDLTVRALSMGKLHHAMMGTAAVAIGSAAMIPGTLLNIATGGGQKDTITFGHPSGVLKVGAQAEKIDGLWTVSRVSMSRSARTLMRGEIYVPDNSI